MTEILVVDGLKYELYTPKDEVNDFHSMVKQQYKSIFGKNTFYFDLRKILKSKSKIGSIPDAYVIDFKLDKWYVVEEELSTHPVYEHIVSQLTRFLIGIKNIKSRSQLREALYKEIDKNEDIRTLIKKQTNSHDIHHALTKLISKQPTIVVIIEEKPTNPKYYEKMSILLDDIIRQRKQQAIEYEQYLKRIVELVKKAKNPAISGSYPTSIDSAAKRALYDNLKNEENLALRINKSILMNKPDGWRGIRIKEKQVKNAIRIALLNFDIVDDKLVETVLELAKKQNDY